ncbi:hypothetical protein A2774_01110 [Candidatus Roizmanbacteria bacterium RIFCSPHIGHO2_01_FULL_39_12c]|uniref:Glycosyltransferase RgtA/B/C/D-like domain-containing protein n=1 Tax=Candidatus Roizmanbacteria bacterium RIFCSPHIGHO2_01_FULL_39_12c TaxID=1802031 RepID=A0A1F7G7T3_9BACT|nr:MAG: hypothetical protein A2774_01110 [Candidatus Roizmanbacteria bacterium RIFCSPHIGHO2_01_FULL_39_12c]OGK46429.1 MAG: hypothetical protein A2963_01520 [Candidatus Roizmanbacteria bacterium RIFCSPLOWO2_01_FULL_40_13]
MKIINSIFTSTNKVKIFLIFFTFGFLIYGNSLFNSFVGDDIGQIKENSKIHSVWNIPSHFIRGTFDEGNVKQKDFNNYYKPVLSSIFTLIYAFSRNNPVGFHLVQIIIHIINSFIIYYLFKYFFRRLISLILALIFLAHPINTEAVVYISALQEPLFLLFGLSALYINIKKPSSLIRTFSIVTLLVLSLLSKETGLVFLLILPLYNLLLERKNLIQALIHSLFASTTYVFFRFVLAGIYFGRNVVIPMNALSLSERLINIPKIIFFYISTFMFPRYLIMFQSWIVKQPNYQDFYIPLLLEVILFVALIIFSIRVYKSRREDLKTILFFFAWFVVGLGAHLQIISLDQTVSDRWFYFPIIGLLAMLGSLLKYLYSTKVLNSNYLIIISLIIFAAFSLRVINRNKNWKNSYTLVTHDINYTKNSHQLERGIAYEHYLRGDYTEAEKHYIKATHIFPSSYNFSALGIFYISIKKYKEAVNAYEDALKFYPENFSSLIWLAISKYKLGDKEGALINANKAYLLSPSSETMQILKTIQEDAPINIH